MIIRRSVPVRWSEWAFMNTDADGTDTPTDGLLPFAACAASPAAEKIPGMAARNTDILLQIKDMSCWKQRLLTYREEF
jgi:hypothetical protein